MRGPQYTQECIDTAQAWPPTNQSRSAAARAAGRSIRVFVSPFFEHVLGQAHPITPIIWFGPFIAAAVYRAFQATWHLRGVAVALFFGGWLLFSLLEYVLHRFVFHMGAHTPKEKLRAFLMHGYHHEFPEDPLRLVAPPLMSWPLGLVFGLLAHWLLGPERWLFGFAGMATGYIAYDWIHYYTHHFRPKGGIGKWLRSYHMLHHFGDRGSRFGVSSPLWDIVFGTYRPIKEGRHVRADGEPLESR
jgi:sterol desaturase/sphingolipid hydroxylase (fatty acid hydroxylase superfamily)